MNFWPISPGHMFCITLGMFSNPCQLWQIQEDKLGAHLFVLDGTVGFIVLRFFNIFWEAELAELEFIPASSGVRQELGGFRLS